MCSMRTSTAEQTAIACAPLYFDTVNDRDYEEKFAGTDPRRKVRLRIYDPHAETALLEMKQKSGEHQLKRSLELSRDEALHLIAGDLSWMPTRPEPFAAEMYGVIQMHGYRPKAIVEYRRRAFVARELKTRITFDSDIRATEANIDIFDENLCLYPVLDPFNEVLEVKYNGFLLAYIRQELNAIEKRPISVSKYALARELSHTSVGR